MGDLGQRTTEPACTCLYHTNGASYLGGAPCPNPPCSLEDGFGSSWRTPLPPKSETLLPPQQSYLCHTPFHPGMEIQSVFSSIRPVLAAQLPNSSFPVPGTGSRVTWLPACPGTERLDPGEELGWTILPPPPLGHPHPSALASLHPSHRAHWRPQTCTRRGSRTLLPQRGPCPGPFPPRAPKRAPASGGREACRTVLPLFKVSSQRQPEDRGAGDIRGKDAR
ncbi:uncharacterized protein LOC104859461 [Fukomys damarensis]|uniref:uncharacterized protein LOC104859461 n=1 Tax=Fukomys damarensis TaxID=885580 RepID=UPI00054002D9|nr:uncharacterized protein LOC104859461 [Fukomys damarensis]